ncbi:MAG: Asp23/Gls24 family envelope stress response protein [Peptoniphilus sp.]|nr:Asp23/Gls24 family envelope stress response protein [Peptoniphilus sp.]MDD7362953.1 Asp23/Gls24 family envelope stress response protein [Bacillota bacterium]MDY6044193.1 Asp23/Gls24 family envelope stress response protein [Peptoniphilus sp.]
MEVTIPTDKGNITIDNQVIATIAGISAMESYGVVGMASRSATDGIFQLLKFENLTRGIEVNSENERIHISLHVIIEYGIRISTVGQNVIDRVQFNVESLTGLDVDRIEVLVEGIRMN